VSPRRLTFSVNINGVYFTTVAFIPLLVKSDLKSVIVIASIAGLILQRAFGSVSYGASKAGALHTANLLAGRLSP
jgi:NAD(P)-dependent dehydrogenase (short-subunit alcohol dehydrogenase family)